METEDGISNAENTECPEGVRYLNNEAVNNGVVVADENGVAEGVQRLKIEAVNNGVGIADGSDVADGDSGGGDCIRTYKRRKHVKLSSERKVQEDCRAYVEAASHLADQAVKEPCDVVVGNTYEKFCLPVNGSDDYSHGHWGNVVLKNLYQSLGDNKGGIEACIREALIHHSKIRCATAVKKTHKIDNNGEECFSQFGWMSHRLQVEANGHATVMHNGCCSESDGHSGNEMCQRALCSILASENFSSLCKVLLENFQGMKPESVFDFSVINSKMKDGVYEQSPTHFWPDIQQVWRKLQDTGNQIVILAKSLSNMSRTSYDEQAGDSAYNPFEDEKQELYNRNSNSHMKLEQTEGCGLYNTCRHCGHKADGTHCLVCDYCEEMCHVSCIEPAVKEIPHQNWYCANCTASGIGSPHKNCVVCDRLNVPKTLNNIAGDETFPTNEETLKELEENSNCTNDRIQVSRVENDFLCKICGGEVDNESKRICSHSFCSNKYYHVRCLTNRQLKSYGPCWYCPSCLCRVCLTDKDDDAIVLCDGCDHAYHIYCMKPPRTSIPKGKWFCKKCDAGIRAIRRAKKAYECNRQIRTGQDAAKPSGNFEKNCNNKRARELDKDGGMDMLLNAADTLNKEDMLSTAANTLNFEENLAVTQIRLQRT